MKLTLAMTLSLLLPAMPTAGQADTDERSTAHELRLEREVEHLRTALQSCSEQRDAARADAARLQSIARGRAEPPRDVRPERVSCGDNRHAIAPPSTEVHYYDRRPRSGDPTADEGVSPISFPRVWGGKSNWLDEHLAAQYEVLTLLYTDDALQELPKQERQCTDPQSRPYCKMAVRLYWIRSAP